LMLDAGFWMLDAEWLIMNFIIRYQQFCVLI